MPADDNRMKFEKQRPEESDASLVPFRRMGRYRRMRRYLVLITSITAVVPLLVLAVINYTSDKRAYRAETNYKISRMLSNTKRTLEFVVEERRSVLSLIINERPYKDLASDASLAATLRNLKDAFGGFVDLGIVDANGIQTYYVGPYDLKGRDYQEQDWFHEVLLRGVFVSDVFMGLRNYPHFVIAFKHDKPDGSFYVLRATLDMELINRQILSLDLDEHSDAFIVNHQGILQTASRFHGDVLDTIDVPVPTRSREREVISDYRRGSQLVTSGYVYIAESPFILMAQMRQQNPFGYWVEHRSDLLFFLSLSIAAILVVVFWSSTHMVNRLREADQRRAKLYHNMEYTAKMASLGRLAAGVAHEINNPLAIINEKAGLMRDMATFTPDFPRKDKTLSLVDSITNSVERCSRVTHRLLGFARRMDMRRELIDLPSLLKEVVSFQTTEAAHRNIEIVYEVPDEVASIESDRGQLQQVFLNVINNAFAAVPERGRVVIGVNQPNSNEVVVTISDNGSGIAKQDLVHIFEPFFSTKGQAGTGLGLSITRDIVEQLGGIIEVVSEPGKGTTFTVNLPVEKVD